MKQKRFEKVVEWKFQKGGLTFILISVGFLFGSLLSILMTNDIGIKYSLIAWIIWLIVSLFLVYGSFKRKVYWKKIKVHWRKRRVHWRKRK